MKLVTLQSKVILPDLLNGKTFYADLAFAPDNLKVPYTFMKEFMSSSSYPIFCAAIGMYTSLDGSGKLSERCALELDVPDNLCTVMNFYDWTDYCCFKEDLGEFEDVCPNFRTPDDFAKVVLAKYDTAKPIQVCIPYIDQAFIVDVEKDASNLNLDKYLLNGGKDKMLSISELRKKGVCNILDNMMKDSVI